MMLYFTKNICSPSLTSAYDQFTVRKIRMKNKKSITLLTKWLIVKKKIMQILMSIQYVITYKYPSTSVYFTSLLYTSLEIVNFIFILVHSSYTLIVCNDYFCFSI